MKYFLIVLFMFIFTSQAFAKTEYYKCGWGNVKVSDPLIGMSKIYKEHKGEWTRAKGRVLDDKVIITNWQYSTTCGSGPVCKVKWIISRLDISSRKNTVTEERYVTNVCKQESWSDNCRSYDIGDRIHSGTCERLIKK